ncbi:PrsW family glutamic-type intramembrane protease [Pseudomonadota bacterium]|nr:PrsW family glutamic-type intramembrane protease [Pseudomonadota bacterium]MDC0244279.1 PrsW family glutamic-type intramembrane protease [Pseudomonadota bacterium]
MYLTLLITVGVPLFIVFAIIYSDRFREPTDLVIKTFFAGVIICFPAAELNHLLIPSYEYSYRAGFTEEMLKFLVLYFYIRPKSAFNEPMDAIVYGVLVSLGFATFENITYVYQGNFEVDSFSLAIMRAVSAIPLHATCGIIMGYFFGLYAFTHSKQFLIKSIIFPIGIHAIYNFLTSYDFFFLYFLVAVMIYARGLHTELSELQSKKAREDETKVI